MNRRDISAMAIVATALSVGGLATAAASDEVPTMTDVISYETTQDIYVWAPATEGTYPMVLVANAKVKLEGASNATVNTGGVLDVDLAGSSDVRYLGEPTLGVVERRGDSTLEHG